MYTVSHWFLVSFLLVVPLGDCNCGKLRDYDQLPFTLIVDGVQCLIRRSCRRREVFYEDRTYQGTLQWSSVDRDFTVVDWVF